MLRKGRCIKWWVNDKSSVIHFIANPGRLSIEASLNPDTTPYVFFVADGSGGHAFAETLEEHNQNVAKWRAIEAQQGEEPLLGVQGE